MTDEILLHKKVPLSGNYDVVVAGAAPQGLRQPFLLRVLVCERLWWRNFPFLAAQPQQVMWCPSAASSIKADA